MKKVQTYMYLFTPFVNQKKSIDIYSAFYSSDKTFQLLHAEITESAFCPNLRWIENIIYQLIVNLFCL